ncbi:Epoxide hydrolase 3 [Cercospora beticola]|uniref:Epoxide hydrolase 3 n=1 Tax=Cercospora beticola TaxID=122368 RepID=A0A2G5HAJ8_CERBT|nr:Epoxide hydrolase 3 [Cercospora beticola]PIA89559.1 Epoxide hydrolase 3 [Cercospora beticola]WPB03356.1 hypothetical protein RHO25_007994 [Cercospora beticola]
MFRILAFAILILSIMSATNAQSCQPWEGFVENNGVRTHYRAAGSGPLLLLVHGFPDNSDTFYHQVPELSKHYTVVTPRLRGFPPSDVPDDEDAYALPNVVGDLVTLIMHFNARQVILGGHDFGAAAIQVLALSKPELVSGLLLMNPPILPRFQELINFDPEQQKASEYTIHFQKYQIGDDKEVVDKAKFIRDPARRKEIEEYLTASPINGMMAYYKKNYPAPPYGQTSPLQNASYSVPSLILWGVEDEYFIPKMVDGIPKVFPGGARLVTFPKAGHWVFQDEPRKVNREIASWLDELKLQE